VAQLRPFGGEDYTINLVPYRSLARNGVPDHGHRGGGPLGLRFTAEIG